MNNRKRTALCLLGAALCVFMTFGAALALGRYPITPAALLAGDAMAVRTFTVLRLPRAVMALVGGFGLGAAGFVYQTVFRNPLASPDIIGVSSGASVGAAFAILFVSSGALSTTVCAFASGLAAVFLSLGLAAAAPGRSKMSLVLAGMGYEDMRARLMPIAKLLGLTELLKKYPYEVSGGQKQRAAVARAIITEPKLLLADEPTGALDSGSTDELLRLFAAINRAGQTILMVTHSVKAASRAGRVLFIKDGQVFHQLYRGEDDDTRFYQRISDTLTMLQSGGEPA